MKFFDNLKMAEATHQKEMVVYKAEKAARKAAEEEAYHRACRAVEPLYFTDAANFMARVKAGDPQYRAAFKRLRANGFRPS